MRKKVSNWLRQRKIVHGVPTPYLPESNGVTGRLSRSLIDTARTIMNLVPLTRQDLLAEAVNTACFLHKRLVAKSCEKGKTTYEGQHRKRSDVRHLRTSGSRSYVYKPNSKGAGNFGERAEEGISVEYCKGDQ